MTNVDDLARLLVPPPGEDVIIRDAVIREWDPTTFENVVEYEGIRLRNVNVGAGAAIEALTYRPGDLVQLELRFTGGKRSELGIGDVAIKGRRIVPGTGAAERAIAFMQTALARQVARGVIGEAIHFDGIDTIETLTSETNFTDLDTVGPRVSDIEVSDVGRALVEFGCTMSSDTALDNIAVSFEVRDADNNVVLAPHGARAIQLTFVDPVLATLTRTVLAELPGAGRYTFTMKYSHSFSTATAQFGHRHMIVTPY